MTYSTLLINTCTIQRYTEGAADAYGVPVRTWVARLTDTDCRWSTPTNREIKVGAELVLADLLLFLNDVDITEQDRVIIDTVTYEVLSVMERQDSAISHHKECFIRTVKN